MDKYQLIDAKNEKWKEFLIMITNANLNKKTLIHNLKYISDLNDCFSYWVNLMNRFHLKSKIRISMIVSENFIEKFTVTKFNHKETIINYVLGEKFKKYNDSKKEENYKKEFSTFYIRFISALNTSHNGIYVIFGIIFYLITIFNNNLTIPVDHETLKDFIRENVTVPFYMLIMRYLLKFSYLYCIHNYVENPSKDDKKKNNYSTNFKSKFLFIGTVYLHDEENGNVKLYDRYGYCNGEFYRMLIIPTLIWSLLIPACIIKGQNRNILR